MWSLVASHGPNYKVSILSKIYMVLWLWGSNSLSTLWGGERNWERKRRRNWIYLVKTWLYECKCSSSTCFLQIQRMQLNLFRPFSFLQWKLLAYLEQAHMHTHECSGWHIPVSTSMSNMSDNDPNWRSADTVPNC